jgi:hypothetical protein
MNFTKKLKWNLKSKNREEKKTGKEKEEKRKMPNWAGERGFGPLRACSVRPIQRGIGGV